MLLTLETSPLHPEEARPFIVLAESKGLALSFDGSRRAEPLAVGRLDMDLVRVSLENAIGRARESEMTGVTERLDRLLRTGTPVQQVDFVLGSRSTYYFPEDIETMVRAGPKVGHRFTRVGFSWLRCRPLADGSFDCEERKIEICLVH